MALNIKSDVREGADEAELLLAEVGEIQRRVAALPDRDTRTADEILGYNAQGLPD